jgi:predicted SAM-dependent methyltransferase
LLEDLPDRVHYGCGGNILPGWLNVDGVTWSFAGGLRSASNITLVDLAGRHPFPDDAFQFAYGEDFIEHLTQADSLTFLTESYRTLRPGGVLRLSFPCLEGVLEKHYADNSFATAAAAKRDAFDTWGHEHFYSRESLHLVARHIGFTGFEEVEYGYSEHTALSGLETRFGQIGLNLNVELTK